MTRKSWTPCEREAAIAGNENYTFDSGAERQNEKLPPSLPEEREGESKGRGRKPKKNLFHFEGVGLRGRGGMKGIYLNK